MPTPSGDSPPTGTSPPVGVPSPAPDGRSETSSSITLDRGLRLLDLLADHPSGLSVSEIAKALGTHRAGVYRLLGPLADHQLVARDASGRFILWFGLVTLASRVSGHLRDMAMPILRQLADELQATAALTLRDGNDAVVATVVEPRGTQLHLAYGAGVRHPLDTAASGLAILAGSAPVPGERAEVREGRQRGWTLSTGELLQGATGVGAPVRPDTRCEAQAAISLVWVAPRDVTIAGRAVARAASQLSSLLHASHISP